jgi:hypothetical protein
VLSLYCAIYEQTQEAEQIFSANGGYRPVTDIASLVQIHVSTSMLKSNDQPEIRNH